MTDYIGPHESMPIIRARLHGDAGDRMQILADGTILKGDGNGVLSPSESSSPRPVIFDTDYLNDCDDAAALRLLLAQERRGVIDLRAVVVSSTHDLAAPSASAHLFDEERSDIPVGQFKGVPATSTVSSDGALIGSWVEHEYAHPDVPRPSVGTVEDAVTTVRRELASRSKRDLTYVATGFLNVLAAVLASPSDGISNKTGVQLFQQAVERVIVMGGDFSGSAEFNVQADPAAAAYAAANCPVPMYWSDAQVGSGVVIGTKIGGQPATDFVRRVFERFGVLTAGRNAHDPMAALLATVATPGDVGLNTTAGTVTVNTGTSVTTFTAGSNGTHHKITKAQPNSYYVPLIDALLVPGLEPAPPAKTFSHRLRRRPVEFTPSQLERSGALVAWLRGEELGAVGSSISSWAAAPGSSLAATQGTAAKQPTVQRGAGERLVARFDGNDDYLDIANAAVRVARPLLYVVITTAVDTGANQDVAGVPHVDGSHTSPFFRYGLQVHPGGFLRGNAETSFGVGDIVHAWSPTTPRLIELDGVSHRLFLDTRLDGDTGGDSEVTYPNATPLRLGGNGVASTGGFQEAFKGDFYELLLLDGALVTMGERWRLWEYFRRRYGLDGRVIGGLYTQTLVANGAVTIDAARGDVAQVTLQANATSSTISGGYRGQKLTIEWIQDATGGRTYVWPTNCKFAGGAAPSDTTASKRSSATLRFDGTNWYEIARSAAVG